MSKGAYKGAKLVAEYHPLENKYYYYTTDQINSTRVVTDDNGTVVYAAAHDPYGGVQQTWVNTFDPALKFSGKERDSESNLDYFGARYYDHTLYRFLSVDPVIPAGRALYNPQRWNLYGYCLNSPLSQFDPDGKHVRSVHSELTRKLAIQAHIPEVIANRIAAADEAVDDKLSTTSLNPLSYRLHFPDVDRVAEAYIIAYRTLNPEELGRALHTIQDFYGHYKYLGRPFFGHLFESGAAEAAKGIRIPALDPDQRALCDLEWYSMMASETLYILEQYNRRLTEVMFFIFQCLVRIMSMPAM